MPSRNADLFTSSEQAVEVDTDTAAAIERGIEAADQGRVVPSEAVRELIPEWISKFSKQSRP